MRREAADLSLVPEADTSDSRCYRIRAAEARTVEAITATGRVLLDCRAAIHHGEQAAPGRWEN